MSSAAAEQQEAMVNLTETLAELDREINKSHRQLRRLSKRLRAVDGTRHRIHPLTNALTRLRHRDDLSLLGLQDFDICELRMETEYDGLLVAVVQAARVAGARIDTLVVRSPDFPVEWPKFAAETLNLEVREVASAGAGVALVVDAKVLTKPGTANATLLEEAVVAIALNHRLLVKEARPVSSVVDQLSELALQYDLRPVHVTGDGLQVVFAKSGLLEERRTGGLFPTSGDGA